MTVLSLPVNETLKATLSCLTPERGRTQTMNRPRLFDLNFRLFFQLGMREPEFAMAHRYVVYLDRAPQVLDRARREVLDACLSPSWPERFGLPHLRSPFIVVRSLARDFHSLANRYVWTQLRNDPSSMDEYL